MLTLLDQFRPAPGPVTGRWAVGVGDTLARLAPVPEPLRDLVRLLNTFGGLAISAEDIEIDGDAADWSDVTAVETHRLLGYLLSGALDKQVGRLPLPWFPFRGAVVGLAAQAALTVVVATAGTVVPGAFEVRIPAEVTYRGVLRERTLSPGVLAALLLADRAVRDALTATAEANGVPVRPADDDAVDAARRRAQRITELVSWVRERAA
ncbi:hypothetical protein [Mycobacterium sp. PS03-16]|uniref:hypothetical protein n=1 Tax=Mycobacterium sp. PS03-16 TaxID=2559611 RepID=UPI00142F66B4|nr:hypothetical protein [Mycobacterium sp. PS03-16]